MELECSGEALDLHASHSPPQRRRRSTFFEKRDTLVPPEEGGNSAMERAVNAHNKNQYLQDISAYYEMLYKEKEAWKNEASERRRHHHDMKSQLKAAAAGSLSTPINYTVLTDEDLDFLKAKIDVGKFAESVLNLKDQVTVTARLMNKLKALNEEVLSGCEVRVDEVQKYILEHSTIDQLANTVSD